MSSPIVVGKNKLEEEYFSSQVESVDPIIDTRFQSYLRFYIYDIINAEKINVNSENLNCSSTNIVIKIKNLYFQKCSIVGQVKDIYQAEKYYLVKIDDSTGCINAKIWKQAASSDSNNNFKTNLSELYKLLDAIDITSKDKNVNINKINYEPAQGDFLNIKGTVRCYNNKLEINALSCTKINSSCEELVQMVLPSIMGKNVYSKLNLSSVEPNSPIANDIKQLNELSPLNKKLKIRNEIKDIETFYALVHKQLLQLCSNLNESVQAETGTKFRVNSSSCNSYSIFRMFRNKHSREYNSVTYYDVLNALKELESRGLIYSCENEFQYLPLN
jgi:hypothetical protein